MFHAHFRNGLVSRRQLQFIAVDSRCCREAPGSYGVKLGNCGDIGTGTKSGCTCTHIQLRSSGVLVPVPNQVVPVPKCSLRTSDVLVPVPH